MLYDILDKRNFIYSFYLGKINDSYVILHLKSSKAWYRFLTISMPNQSPMPAELFHCQINYLWIPNYFIAKSIIYEFLIISLPNPLKEMIVYVYVKGNSKAHIKEKDWRRWSTKLIYLIINLKLLLQYLIFEFYKCKLYLVVRIHQLLFERYFFL